MYITGFLFVLGIIYMEKIFYNIFYYYVILENMSIKLYNKYIKQRIHKYEFNNKKITTMYNDDFSRKVYILDDINNQSDINNSEIDFFKKNIFISVLLFVNNKSIDLTNEINCFIHKNNKLALNYDFALIINDFLILNLSINELNYRWKIIDKKMLEKENTEIIFNIDKDYNIVYL